MTQQQQERVAVVTGSNKGIGYEIVRGLCKQFDGVVYLTARNEENGRKALEELAKEGLKPSFHQLDIADDASISQFADYLQQTHGGIDVLVNNAAIACYENGNESADILVQNAIDTLRINYTGTNRMTMAMIPLLRTNARVVNVASRLGMLNKIPGEALRAQFADPSATLAQIDQLVDGFIKARENGTVDALGYPSLSSGNPYASYSLSKVGLIAANQILQRMVDHEETQTATKNVLVSAMCPGYCATDLNKHSGPLTAEQGAQTAIFLALLPAEFNGPKGAFWAEKKVVDWTA